MQVKERTIFQAQECLWNEKHRNEIFSSTYSLNFEFWLNLAFRFEGEVVLYCYIVYFAILDSNIRLALIFNLKKEVVSILIISRSKLLPSLLTFLQLLYHTL